jgi:hypothetical protein
MNDRANESIATITRMTRNTTEVPMRMGSSCKEQQGQGSDHGVQKQQGQDIDNGKQLQGATGTGQLRKMLNLQLKRESLSSLTIVSLQSQVKVLNESGSVDKLDHSSDMRIVFSSK